MPRKKATEAATFAAEKSIWIRKGLHTWCRKTMQDT